MNLHEQMIHIVAGGPKQLIPNLLTYHQRRDITWIGVDRGVLYLLESGITPDIAVGDFDSVTNEEWQKIEVQIREVQKFNPIKDETDMELALKTAIQQNPSAITIFGATGGRLDHFFANAFLLAKYQTELTMIIKMIDKNNELTVYHPGTYMITKHAKKKYISFIPLSKKINSLNLDGFKYPLINQDVHFGSTLCISNELKQEIGTFSFQKGILMMVRSID